MAAPSFPTRRLPILVLFLFLLLLLPSLSSAQQIGSFFTAIYLNGALVSSSQTSCSNMGQGQYCCGSGMSCAWDDAGKVACCPAGSSCQGSAYGGSGGGGSSQGAGQWTTPQAQSSWQQTSTTDCNCGTSAGGGAVVPIVPVTKATLQTSYYSVPTSTLYTSPATATTTVVPQQQPQTTTVIPVIGVGNAGLSTSGLVGCATVSTVTYANVGQPVKTQGCFIIVNGAVGRVDRIGDAVIWSLASCLGALGVLFR